MNKFKVGDKIIGNLKAWGRYGITTTGTKWVVQKIEDRMGISGEVADIRVGRHPTDLSYYYVCSQYFDLQTPDFSLDRPVCHRDGSGALVDLYDDERPYRAEYKGLRLSYDRYGRFYPDGESPCDLVNS